MDNPNKMNVYELAEFYASFFQKIDLPNSDRKRVAFKFGAGDPELPPALRNACHELRDYISIESSYNFTLEYLEWVAANEPETPQHAEERLEELANDFVYKNVSIWTNELTAWLAEHTIHVALLDEVLKDPNLDGTQVNADDLIRKACELCRLQVTETINNLLLLKAAKDE